VVDEIEAVPMTRDADGFDAPAQRQQVHDLMDHLGDLVPEEPCVALVVSGGRMEHRHRPAASHGGTAAKLEGGGLDVRAADVQAQQEGRVH